MTDTPVTTPAVETAQEIPTLSPEELAKRVFAGKLGSEVTEESIKATFSAAGTVEDVQLISKNKKRVNFAFVKFSSAEEALKAVDTLNETEVAGSIIRVELSRPNTPRPARAPKEKKKKVQKQVEKVERPEPIESTTTVYISGFAPEETVDKESVTALFDNFEVTNVVIRSAYRGRLKPKAKYALVTFAQEEDQQNAIDEVDGQVVGEVTFSVKKGLIRKRKAKKKEAVVTEKKVKQARKPRVRIPRAERIESDDVVYVSGFDTSVETSDLEELFKSYGVTAVSVRSAFRGRGNPKQKFAFVTVDTKENQEDAIAALNESDFNGATLTASKAFTIPTLEEIAAATLAKEAADAAAAAAAASEELVTASE